MDSRNKAIEGILRQIRAKRAEMDPEVLDKLRTLAARMQGVPDKEAQGTVPYDKEAARKVIEMFLKEHPAQKAFQSKLLAFLKSQSH